MRFKVYLLAITSFLSFCISGAHAEPTKLVGFGDSLMAGYQLPASDAFPVKLQAALQKQGLNVDIANAGVSGDTTSAGLARIDWSVPDDTDGVILELGANDMLRGIAPSQTEKNLDDMISRLKDRGIAIFLVGMKASPNMGADYATQFNPIYERLAQKHNIPLYDFFLDGVVTDAGLKIEDGMHPNAQGIDVMVERMAKPVRTFVEELSKTKS